MNYITRVALWWLGRSGVRFDDVLGGGAGGPGEPPPYSHEEIEMTRRRIAEASRRLRLDNLSAEADVMQRRP